MKIFHSLICLAALLISTSTQAELYGAAGNGSDTNLYIISETGATTAVGTTGRLLTGLAFNPLSGELYGVTSSRDATGLSLLKINPETAGVQEDIVLSDGPLSDISFAPDGTLFGWCEGCGDALATVDLTTGDVTVVADFAYFTRGSALDFSPDGRMWRAGESIFAGTDCQVAAWSPDTGDAIAATATMAGCEFVGAATHGPNGEFFVTYHYTQDQGQPTPKWLGVLNKDTGSVTTLGSTLTDISALAWRSEELEYYSITPCRVFDTRSGSPFTNSETRGFLVWGACGIPQQAVSVEINLTAVNTTGFGYLRAWAFGEPEPTATLMTWPEYVSISNSTSVPINNDFGSDLNVKIYLPYGGVAHLAGDAVGYRTRK